MNAGDFSGATLQVGRLYKFRLIGVHEGDAKTWKVIAVSDKFIQVGEKIDGPAAGKLLPYSAILTIELAEVE